MAAAMAQAEAHLWQNPDMEGNLIKKGSDNLWAWRWCRIKGRKLFYFEHKAGALLGSIELKDFSFKLSPSPSRPFSFDLTGPASFRFCAVDEDDLAEWARLLRTSAKVDEGAENRPSSPRRLTPGKGTSNPIPTPAQSTNSKAAVTSTPARPISAGDPLKAKVTPSAPASLPRKSVSLPPPPPPINQDLLLNNVLNAVGASADDDTPTSPASGEDLVSQMLEDLKQIDFDKADQDELAEISERIATMVTPLEDEGKEDDAPPQPDGPEPSNLQILRKMDADQRRKKQEEASSAPSTSGTGWIKTSGGKVAPKRAALTKTVTSSHRNLTPDQISKLKEMEEKARVVRLKRQILNHDDPYRTYNIQENSFGKGSVGEVFFGTRASDGKRVAIKKLEIVRKGKDRLPLILREVEIISTSPHPNIVTYFGAYEVGEHLWVVMEFMSAGSLYDIVKNFPNGVKAREEDCAYVVREVTRALEFLHSKKRIHRDIKVDNILLDLDGSVKLADFGTAVQLTFQRMRRNTLAGTPYYMAPELIQRIPYGEKVDIWSLGITVVEMMTGGPPFYDLDPQEALDAIVKYGVTGLEETHMGRTWSADIRDFVNARCLNIIPDNRPSCTELLKHPFIRKSGSREDFRKILSNARGNLDEVGVPGADGCSVM